MNAIEFDADSNLLISSRHMDEITKINAGTGDIIWRWGGKNNEFTLEGDSIYFSHQHAIRRTDAGTYTMFDNGNFHHDQPHPFSRAVEYQLDQTNKIATKKWEFHHHPEIFAGAMGYVQRLPNDGTLIGWGECDSVAITELDSQDNTLFEMGMSGGNYSYRAYKYDSNYIHSGFQKALVPTADDPSLRMIVMPNPVTDAAKIKCVIPKDGYANLSLYDALGREVSKIYSGYVGQGNHEFIVNAKDLDAGAYYIHGNLNGSSVHEQIVVLK
jgi:hypothetical protein